MPTVGEELYRSDPSRQMFSLETKLHKAPSGSTLLEIPTLLIDMLLTVVDAPLPAICLLHFKLKTWPPPLSPIATIAFVVAIPCRNRPHPTKSNLVFPVIRYLTIFLPLDRKALPLPLPTRTVIFRNGWPYLLIIRTCTVTLRVPTLE